MVIDNGELIYSMRRRHLRGDQPDQCHRQVAFAERRTHGTNNGIQVTQFFGISYDSLSNIIFGGAQDAGTPQQSASAEP